MLGCYHWILVINTLHGNKSAGLTLHTCTHKYTSYVYTHVMSTAHVTSGDTYRTCNEY